jgi:hypothetical protein
MTFSTQQHRNWPYHCNPLELQSTTYTECFYCRYGRWHILSRTGINSLREDVHTLSSYVRSVRSLRGIGSRTKLGSCEPRAPSEIHVALAAVVLVRSSILCFSRDFWGTVCLFVSLHRPLPHLYSFWYHGVPPSSPAFTTMTTNKSSLESSVLDMKNDDKDKVIPDIPLVNPSTRGEPIVTRRELWSYYCKCCRDFPSSLQWF